jgi:hypothetical protein
MHVQILNPLLGKGFSSIRAGRINFDFARQNLPPGIGEVWCFLTMSEKQKTPQIQYLQGFLLLSTALRHRCAKAHAVALHFVKSFGGQLIPALARQAAGRTPIISNKLKTNSLDIS